jgi:hypothetical protein
MRTFKKKYNTGVTLVVLTTKRQDVIDILKGILVTVTVAIINVALNSSAPMGSNWIK